MVQPFGKTVWGSVGGSLVHAFGPGPDPGVTGSSPASGSLHGLLLPLPVSLLSLSLYVYHK